jgi:hypothetical protein
VESGIGVLDRPAQGQERGKRLPQVRVLARLGPADLLVAHAGDEKVVDGRAQRATWRAAPDLSNLSLVSVVDREAAVDGAHDVAHALDEVPPARVAVLSIGLQPIDMASVGPTSTSTRPGLASPAILLSSQSARSSMHGRRGCHDAVVGQCPAAPPPSVTSIRLRSGPGTAAAAVDVAGTVEARAQR